MTYECKHFSIGNVKAATCGTCGTLALRVTPPAEATYTLTWKTEPSQ